MSQLLKEYVYGDMRIRYVTDDERRRVGLVLLPESLPYPEQVHKQMQVESLIQYKLAGDIYDEAYALGTTMRNSESVRSLAFQGQTEEILED